MNLVTTHQPLDRENRIEIILDMMERHCPLLLKAGGGPLIQDQPQSGKRVDDVSRMEMERLWNAGKSQPEISRRTGFSAATVWRYTKKLRPKP